MVLVLELAERVQQAALAGGCADESDLGAGEVDGGREHPETVGLG